MRYMTKRERIIDEPGEFFKPRVAIAGAKAAPQ